MQISVRRWDIGKYEGFLVLNVVVTVLGIPAVRFYRSNFQFDLHYYLFMVLHSVFFLSAYLFTLRVIRFTWDHYFVHMEEKERIIVQRLWRNIRLLSIVFFIVAFGTVALKDWGRYLSNPVLHESTPPDDANFGSLFSYGPWGWTIFALFTISAILLFDGVITQIMVFVAYLKFGWKQSTATREEWRAWLLLYLVFLVWTIIFTLPYSVSSGRIMFVFYSTILLFPTIGYVVESIVIGRIQPVISPIKGIEDLVRLQERPSLNPDYLLLRDFSVLFAFFTFISVTSRYLVTSNHFLANPIFYSLGVLLISGQFGSDFLRTSLNEVSLEELLNTFEKNKPLKETAGKYSPEDIHLVLSLKVSHFFILDRVKNNSPVELSTLRDIYPNSSSNFRSSMKTLVDNGYIDVIPNIEKMNSRLVTICDKGVEVLSVFQNFVTTEIGSML